MTIAALLPTVVLGPALAALYAPPARAQSVKSLDYSIHQEYLSTRALGMGNAFTAVSDDGSAIFYDPAALARRRERDLKIYLRAGATPQSIGLVHDVNSVKKQDSADQPQGYADLITRHYGDDFYYRAPTLGVEWARPNWGFAFIPFDPSLDASVHRQVGPMLNVNLYQDTTVAGSYGAPLAWLPKGNLLSWGATAKAVYRVHVGQAVSAGQLATGTSILGTAGADEGLTFDLDLAANWRMPRSGHGFFKYVVPTLAFDARNLIDYGFKPNLHVVGKNSGAPPRLQRRLDLGTKFELPRFGPFEPHFALDVRDIGYDQWSLKKGYHVGLEAKWRAAKRWRGHASIGDNEGYFTVGAGAGYAAAKIELATYGEEIGTAAEPKESRRYVAELAVEF